MNERPVTSTMGGSLSRSSGSWWDECEGKDEKVLVFSHRARSPLEWERTIAAVELYIGGRLAVDEYRDPHLRILWARSAVDAVMARAWGESVGIGYTVAIPDREEANSASLIAALCDISVGVGGPDLAIARAVIATLGSPPEADWIGLLQRVLPQLDSIPQKTMLDFAVREGGYPSILWARGTDELTILDALLARRHSPGFATPNLESAIRLLRLEGDPDADR